MLAAALAVLALVPADPPPRTVDDVQAAGDVVVYSNPTRTDATAGGKPVAIAGLAPALATSPDGTAVIAALGRRGLFARIRRAGTGFARPRTLGDAELYDIAVAPGGWTAAAWITPDLRRIAAAVVDPHGRVDRRVLERSGVRDYFSRPQIGVDARGRVTVAWTRWRETRDYEGTRQHVRVARFDRRWRGAVTVGTGADPIFGLPEWPLVGLAVTPGGRSLLAWATRRGIRVSENGARARTLAKLHTPGSPTVALNEDGAAVVAFSQATEEGDDPILAIDRGDKRWSTPHRITGGGVPEHTSDGDDGAQDVALSSALAADGRAVVTWMTDGAAAATGVAGGAWAPARRVTIPTRSVATPPRATLDAAGNPWVTWVEGALYDERGLPAGALLLPEAQAPPTDTVAPALTATIPRTMRIGALRVPVTCSEPCDVRVQLTAHPEFGFPDAEAVRAVTSSARVTVRPLKFVRESWRERPPDSIQVDVLASDRAGNVARVTATVLLR